MKILHIVEDFSINSGGLRTVVKELDIQLKMDCYNSYILSSVKEKQDDVFVVKTNNKWLYSKEWENKIDRIVVENKINIIHIHGIWLYPQYIGAKYAVKNKIPFVLSSHGILQPWLWKKGSLKKKLYFKFKIKRWFTKATVFHSITADESKNLSKYFDFRKIVEIPNLISFPHKKVTYKPENYILYLGRLNKTKGIDILLEAFSRIENNSFKLKIAGNFNEYKKYLEKLVIKYNLQKKVEFLGAISGESKIKLIANAWVMVSPSYSDVIGMVNLEAASQKTPMITTFNTGLKKEWSNNGGKLINPNTDELEEQLSFVIKWSSEERRNNGEKLFSFVKENYSWEKQIVNWINLYKKVLNDSK